MNVSVQNSMTLMEAERIIEGLASIFVEANYKTYEHGSDGGTEPAQPPDIEARYRTLVEQVPAVVFMIFLDRGISEAYVSPHIEAALGFSQAEWLDDPIRWYRQIHPADKERWNVETAQMVFSGQPLRSVYRIIARDGHVVWFQCEVKMVRTKEGRPWFVHGIAFDINELKKAEEDLQKARDDLEKRVEERTKELALTNAMLQVEVAERRRMQEDLLHARRELEIRVQERTGELAVANQILQGEMIERKRLEKSILEISEREKRRIAQDLHDGLGQQLTGIAFLSKVLEQKLKDKASPYAGDAVKIAQLVNESINQTRELAKGLLPVQAEENGFVSALQHLAAEVEELFAVSCVFKGGDVAPICDLDLATHLYRIAQEAVTNAVKHGHADEIVIDLEQCEHKLYLTVRDNGIGFPKIIERRDGMGLRIMNYRASMIGATLEIKNNSNGGAAVVCQLALYVKEQGGYGSRA
ncbi:MAG: PAS domain-containing protein [Candidatus Binatia bacterium]